MKRKLLNTLLAIFSVFACAFGLAACNDTGNAKIPPTEGLSFEQSWDKDAYIVTGIGTATDKRIVIPSTFNDKPVISIGDWAFSYYAITSITIPNSVTSIGSGAFSWCTSLTSITIPNSVTYIGNRAFNFCTAITRITIPNNVTSIEYAAFHGCTKLTSVTIPISITSIGASVFYGCDNLTRVAIPDNVTSIGTMAFGACNRLTDVYYSGSETDWERITISLGNECLTNANIHYNHNG